MLKIYIKAAISLIVNTKSWFFYPSFFLDKTFICIQKGKEIAKFYVGKGKETINKARITFFFLA